MPQGVLSYKYEEEINNTGMTAYAGLPVYLDLAFILGLTDQIRTHMHLRTQGWTDEQIITSLILLNLAGGDCVDDMNILEKDEGFCKVLQKVELKGLSRHSSAEHRSNEGEKKNIVLSPSPSSIFRYLDVFHEPEQEKLRVAGKAFIPLSNEYLQNLMKINRDFIASVQKHNPCTEATLDQDATPGCNTEKGCLLQL